LTESAAEKAALMMLGIAAAGWYVSSRSAVQALAGAASAPGRRALGYWVPTAIVALGAVLIGRPEAAVGVIFASSVASLTLVLGIITIAARHTQPTDSRRLWAFVLPVALIALLIGFSGGIKWIHVPILLLQGVTLLLVWNDPPTARLAADPSLREFHRVDDPPADRSIVGRAALLVFSMLAGGVAAWAGLIAARDLSARLELPGTGLVAALMLSPALVLAMIGMGSVLAGEGRYDEAASSQVGYVLLNLCLLLPLTAGLWMTRPVWHAPRPSMVAASTNSSTKPATTSTTATTAEPAPDRPHALPYPMGVWRVDTVMLIALGLLLLPVALGKWSIGMAEGYGLIVSYTVYMVLTAWLARG
jgi:Ca2+/Na+ antiporter